jgi:diguanylate cyclase (GGDEF)-like protein/hemerythrin-like metal-binding protein/PAS domain S-box-containing protein
MGTDTQTPGYLDAADDGRCLPRCREIIAKAGVGLAVMDLDGKLREVNPAFCEVTGYHRDELLSTGFDVRGLLRPDDVPGLEEGLRALRAGDEQGYRKTLQLSHGDGAPVWVEWIVNMVRVGNDAPHVLLTVIDVTEQKRIQDAFRDMSFLDPLTKLANRRLLVDRLKAAIARAQRERCGVCLLFIDLDNFKPVNDSFGHDVGDWLLNVTARRLLECLRAYDTAARFGGDEFVVLIPDVTNPDTAGRVAERILAMLNRPFCTDDGKRIEISASIGMASYPDNAYSARELLHAGDEAMYRAKQTGRNRVARSERVGGGGVVQAVEAEPVSGLINLRWDASYASGNVFIDGEHSELFRQANRLLDLALGGLANPSTVRSSLQRLVQSLADHFEHEERLLAERQFAGLEEHAVKHRRLLEHAGKIAQLVTDASIPIGELLRFLVAEVIHGHLLTEDIKYFELLKTSPRR